MKTCALDLDITKHGTPVHGRYYASIERLARIDLVVDGRRVYSEGLDAHGPWL